MLENVRIQTIIIFPSSVFFYYEPHFDSVLEGNNVRPDEVTAVFFLCKHKILAQRLGYFF